VKDQAPAWVGEAPAIGQFLPSVHAMLPRLCS
jgi:hypothetical protein